MLTDIPGPKSKRKVPDTTVLSEQESKQTKVDVPLGTITEKAQQLLKITSDTTGKLDQVEKEFPTTVIPFAPVNKPPVFSPKKGLGLVKHGLSGHGADEWDESGDGQAIIAKLEKEGTPMRVLPTKRMIFFPDEQSANYYDGRIKRRDEIKQQIANTNLEIRFSITDQDLLDENDIHKLALKVKDFESLQNQRIEEVQQLDTDLKAQIYQPGITKPFKGLSQKYKVTAFHFPAYSSPVGTEIDEYQGIMIHNSHCFTAWSEFEINYLLKEVKDVIDYFIDKEDKAEDMLIRMAKIESEVEARREAQKAFAALNSNINGSANPRHGFHSGRSDQHWKTSAQESPNKEPLKSFDFEREFHNMKLDDKRGRDPTWWKNNSGASSINDNPMYIVGSLDINIGEFKPGKSLLFKGDEWKEYVKQFLLQCSYKDIKNPAKKKQALLMCAGELVNNINTYDKDPPSDSKMAITPEDDEFDILLKKVFHHLGYVDNKNAKLHCFNTATYDKNLTIADNILIWEKHAYKAGLHNASDRLLEKLLAQHPDSHLVSKALEQNWDLERFKESAAAREIAKAASSSIRNENSSNEKRVFKVDIRTPNKPQYKSNQNTEKDCYRCGSRRCVSMTQGECPATNSECRFCGKMGHFIRKCKKRLREEQPNQYGNFNRGNKFSHANYNKNPPKQTWGKGFSADRQSNINRAPMNAMSQEQIQKLKDKKDKYKKMAKKSIKPSKSKKFVREVRREAITDDSDTESEASDDFSSDSD